MQAMSLAEDDQETELPEKKSDVKDMIESLLNIIKSHDRQLDEIKQVQHRDDQNGTLIYFCFSVYPIPVGSEILITVK